ncbi:Luciferase-like monooxygenase [Asanoa hainanensis]|uniref:Luciferase-like monooxygenase n=1 Tax=Asanoa hainanensis TaxID=560556 RepID=A0A239P802_9ACTN|nr:LLM class flavin-dependent oxidoreductase [Asanoa hainanensis]SNT63161.1 Luciferase-like monooxygenase [Asanoa hainanensis]
MRNDHGVRFGVFVAPDAGAIDRVRANVAAADATGFDYVTIQDHPYVAQFLDTFSLAASLLSENRRIRVMTDVANLALRPPAMLAKTAASLDLLSGGRFELGLGGGRNWPQIAGLGGPTWSPGQTVTAVEEAILILRAMWTDQRTAHLDGKVFHLDAQTGPAPAHNVGIWLGAVGPRMLDLVGRRADGWIAPLGTPFESKPVAQERIDRAAVAAGREPTDVSRVIQLVGSVTARRSTTDRPRTGPGAQPILTTPEIWGRIIAEFVTEERFDTVNFVPHPENVEQISLFGTEVIPAARAAIRKARS